MKWIASGLKHGEPIEKAGIFVLKENDLRIRIHHYKGCGEEWFLSCFGLGIDTYGTGEVSFDEAVKKAKKIVLHRIELLHNEALKFVLDDTENEKV